MFFEASILVMVEMAYNEHVFNSQINMMFEDVEIISEGERFNKLKDFVKSVITRIREFIKSVWTKIKGIFVKKKEVIDQSKQIVDNISKASSLDISSKSNVSVDIDYIDYVSAGLKIKLDFAPGIDVIKKLSEEFKKMIDANGEYESDEDLNIELNRALEKVIVSLPGSMRKDIIDADSKTQVINNFSKYVEKKKNKYC